MELDDVDTIDSLRKEKIKKHYNTLQSFNNKELSIQKKIDEFHLNAATAARNGKDLPDDKAFRISLEKDDLELKELQKVYNDSLSTVINDLIAEKGKYDSNVIKTLALSIKQKEISLKVQNRLKEAYPISDPETESNLIGYKDLLEWSYRLYPGDRTIIKYLGDEYKSTGNFQKAIDMYTLFLNQSPPSKSQDDADVALSLAGLYSASKNYIQSIRNYRTFLDFNKEISKSIQTRFTLGDIFFRRLGDYENAEIEFIEYLKSFNISGDNISDSEKIKNLKKKFIAEACLAKIYKSRQKRELEDEYLKKARDSFTQMKEEEKSFIVKLNQQKEVVRVLKIKSIKDDSTLNPLKDEISKLESLEQIYSSMIIELQAVPIVDLLFQMAGRSEDRRDYDATTLYYREIQEYGVVMDKKIALDNILRIEKIKKDGIYRQKIER